jgi:hypothetical protein
MLIFVSFQRILMIARLLSVEPATLEILKAYSTSGINSPPGQLENCGKL